MSKLKKNEALRIMKRKQHPDPGNEFWAGYWNRLEARMNEERAFEAEAVCPPVPAARPARGRFLPLIPRWAMASAAGVFILLAGIQIGRLLGPGGAPAGPAMGNSPGQNPVLAGQIADYFTRSKVILLSLANFDARSEDPYALNMGAQQQVSRELVDRGRELEARLSGAEGKRYKNLIGELKTILVQIANLDPEENSQAAEIVRNGFKLREILFKISISLMSLPATGKTAGASL